MCNFAAKLLVYCVSNNYNLLNKKSMKIKQLLTKTLLVAAGLLVGVNGVWAESLIFSEDFSGPSYNVTWGGTSAGGISPAVADGALKVANGSQSGDRSAYVAFGSNAYTGSCRLTFDMGMTKSGWSGKNNYFHVLPSATTARYPDTSNAALSITQDANGAITIAGESVGTYDGTMLTYDLYLNTVTGSAKVIIKDGETTLKTISYNTTATGINTFNLQFNKNNGAFAIDNIRFYSLTAPAFTLSENSKSVSVGGSETVNVTDITGEVSVVSNNTSAATVSYAAGTITINGVAAGVATITVTGTNDGLTLERTIDVTVGSVAKTNITVNYLCGGSPIAAATTIENVTIGSTLTLSDITYSETIAGVGCRYANPTFSVSFPYTVVENGVIDITYIQQNSVSTLNIYGSVAGNNYLLHTYALDGKYVGDAVLVTYPEYYLLDGTIYSTANKQFSGTDYYSGSFTLTGTDPVLTYNSVESNVVYFSEAENIIGGTENASGNANIRCSDAKGAYFESATDVVTLPAGRYTIHSQVWGGHNTDDSKNVDFIFNDGTSDFYVHRTTGALNPKSQEFTLTSTATITVTGGSSGKVLDMVYIVKTGEVATIGTTGYTTFASSGPLNIDGMTASTGTVKAYYVTASDVKSSSVALTEVTGNVAAGTGLILEGTAGATITIPVVASGTDYTATNMLVGCTTNTDITTSTANYGNFYVLSATAAAFKNIGAWVLANSTLTIPAGKAYLDTTNAGVVGASSLTFDLGGEATGIADVRGKMEDVRSDFFDLQGRKVAQPTKGLYIVNGRKVVIK